MNTEERILADLAPAWRAVAARWSIPGYEREDVELVAEEAALEWIRAQDPMPEDRGLAAYRCGRHVNRAIATAAGKAAHALRETPVGLSIEDDSAVFPSDWLLEAALSSVSMTVVQRTLCQMVSQGYDVETAAAVVGVGRTVAFREMNAIRAKVATLLDDGRNN